MLTRAKEVRWRGLLVANCVPKWATSVSKQSMDHGGRRVNQLKIEPFRDVGNTRQKIVSSHVYNPTWVVKTSICSSGFIVSSYRSIVPSYRSIVKPFHLGGKFYLHYPIYRGMSPWLPCSSKGFICHSICLWLFSPRCASLLINVLLVGMATGRVRHK